MVTIKADELKALDSMMNVIRYCESRNDVCKGCLFCGACPFDISTDEFMSNILNNILERGVDNEKLYCDTCSCSE